MKADSSSFAATAPITPATTSVCVMGLGYIGLPTASILANKGYHVLGVDVRPEVVQTINQGASTSKNRTWRFWFVRRLTVVS